MGGNTKEAMKAANMGDSTSSSATGKAIITSQLMWSDN